MFRLVSRAASAVRTVSRTRGLATSRAVRGAAEEKIRRRFGMYRGARLGGWVVIGLGAFAATKSFTIIDAGEIGLIELLGDVSKPIHPGIQVVNPFASVIRLNTRTQEIAFECKVPTSEGLIIDIEMSVLYRLNPEQARELYTTIGMEYRNVVLDPTIRSALRSVVSTHEAKALYSSGRAIVKDEIETKLFNVLAERGIILEEILLRDVKLPAKVAASIERKLEMEQESERMKFTLITEKQESARKAIEAQGTAEFQRIVSEGINDDLLRWKGIEASKDLAKSPNTKIVMFGNPKDGLPVVLGGL
eukprot:m.199593 g.199593  ORF g.199593 m.199593 type:complete len:305 (-) comp32740_c1_seq1:262-1176(-)